MPDLVVRGHHLWYREALGDPAPPPLVLLHGAGSSSLIWLYQLRALQSDRSCFAPDLPGHGKSDDDPTCTTPQRYLDYLEGFLHALDLPPFVLAGHALGASLALDFAAAHPERVRALILVSAGATLPASPLLFEALQGSIQVWTRFMEDLLYSLHTPRRFVHKSNEGGLHADPDVVLRDFQMAATYDVTAAASIVRTPTLLITGHDDAMTPPALTEALDQRLHDATLDIVDQAGHMVMMEQHRRVNNSIRRFLLRRL